MLQFVFGFPFLQFPVPSTFSFTLVNPAPVTGLLPSAPRGWIPFGTGSVTVLSVHAVAKRSAVAPATTVKSPFRILLPPLKRLPTHAAHRRIGRDAPRQS